MSRRKLCATGLGAIFVAVAPGCVPLFGLLLRGGALRAFAAGSRLGGVTSLASLGRGVGIASRSATSVGVNMPRAGQAVRIVDKEGTVLARSVQDGQATLLMRGNQQVFRSHANASNQRDVGRLDHVDLHGNNVGRSTFERSDRVDHYAPSRTNREVKIGHDVILRGAQLIRHFDENENMVGETELMQSGAYTDVVSDTQTQKFLADLEAQDEQCPEVVSQRDVYYNTFRGCNNGSASACADLPTELRRLRVLEAACQ